NPTGDAQVVMENLSGSGSHDTSRSYFYGLERISQYRQFSGGTQTSYYIYDGHGSVRALTDQTGNVTDTYDYDAFGNEIHSTGTTANEFLFAGEQYDPDLHLYYNRARYLNVPTGRFWTMDSFEGNGQDPLSLHKYLYGEADPVNSTDPTGKSISNFVYGQQVHAAIGTDFEEGGEDGISDATIETILEASVSEGGSLRPDLTDRATQEVYEIKPVESTTLGYAQLALYLIILNRYDPQKRTWIPGATYLPPPTIQLGGGVIALVYPPAGGVIIYDILNPVEILGLAALATRLSAPSLDTDFAAATLEEVF
ncbi:MAG: RHS repeat-associated core domain-containing protein, partial [Candidatus Acidiferrales bacterium]